MYKYLLAKLEKYQKDLLRAKTDMVNLMTGVEKGGINRSSLEDLCSNIKKANEMGKLFSKDAIQHLSVAEVIELHKKDLITIDEMLYAYKYEKPVTLSEASILRSLSYQFNDIRLIY